MILFARLTIACSFIIPEYFPVDNNMVGLPLIFSSHTGRGQYTNTTTAIKRNNRENSHWEYFSAWYRKLPQVRQKNSRCLNIINLYMFHALTWILGQLFSWTWDIVESKSKHRQMSMSKFLSQETNFRYMVCIICYYTEVFCCSQRDTAVQIKVHCTSSVSEWCCQETGKYRQQIFQAKIIKSL